MTATERVDILAGYIHGFRVVCMALSFMHMLSLSCPCISGGVDSSEEYLSTSSLACKLDSYIVYVMYI